MNRLSFLKWESLSQDSIDFKRCYVDITRGDVITGLILSQIVYWFLPSKNGGKKTRIVKEGRDWLAKEQGDWWQECRVTKKQAKRALLQLCNLGIIDVRYWMFAGRRTTHIGLNEDVLEGLLLKLQDVRCDLEGTTDDEPEGAPEAPTRDYVHRLEAKRKDIDQDTGTEEDADFNL